MTNLSPNAQMTEDDLKVPFVIRILSFLRHSSFGIPPWYRPSDTWSRRSPSTDFRLRISLNS